MIPDFLPVWVVLLLSVGVVMISLECGYHLGHRSRRKSEDEKESPVSAIAGSVLGLVAFMMAFTFGIVAQRYDARKSLVREEANAIGTTWLRADFLPPGHREEAKALLKGYVEQHLSVVENLRSGRMEDGEMADELAKVGETQKRLWAMAVENARLDMNSDVAALYIDSLNGMIDLHSMRVAVALQARIPSGIWVTLCLLTVLGMLSVGYQMGIAGSKRSLAQAILAVSFSLVIVLITMLDRPHATFIKVSQQPFADLLDSMK